MIEYDEVEEMEVKRIASLKSELATLMGHHDWYAEYSDSYSVIDKGRAEWLTITNKLGDLALLIGFENTRNFFYGLAPKGAVCPELWS